MLFRECQVEIEDFVRAAVGLPPLSSEKITLVQLALDGSWDGADARCFASGGVVGLQSHWMALGQSWEDILRPYGITSFHMVEAMNFRGQFERLGREWGELRIAKRDQLLNDLVAVAEQTKFSALGLGADIRLFGEQKNAVKKREIFQAVILDALESLHPNYRLGILCDREQDAHLSWLENFMSRHTKHRERIWALCFVDDRYVPAVQVADLWTYLLREDSERNIFNPTEPENPLFTRLAATAGKSQHIRSNRPEFLRLSGLDDV